MMPSASVAAAWRRLDATGLERFELLPDKSGWMLRGTILLVHQGRPYEARYLVTCDAAWATRAFAIDLRGPEGSSALGLAVEDGRWADARGEREGVRGCVDVDLGWTPSTNTLPIRRLGLAVGESRAVQAAWVRFPELTVEPLDQEYRRLSERRYRYTSAGGRFVAELEVDDDGLVTAYGEIWVRA
jgi:hypothetical protein